MCKFLHVTFSKCAYAHEKIMFAGESNNDSKHCCHIATKFHITHGSCNLICSKNKPNNKMLNLNVDDDFYVLKQMHCMSKRAPVSEVVEARSLHVKIMKELMPHDDNEFCICRNMKRSLVAKMSKANDDFIDPNHDEIPAITQKEEDDDDNAMITNEVACAKAKRKKR